MARAAQQAVATTGPELTPEQRLAARMFVVNQERAAAQRARLPRATGPGAGRYDGR